MYHQNLEMQYHILANVDIKLRLNKFKQASASLKTLVYAKVLGEVEAFFLAPPFFEGPANQIYLLLNSFN